jgi:hypothetical protein
MPWRRSNEWTPAEVVAQQQAMNAQTWATLQQHEVTEATELRLDFAYDAPSGAAAEQLAEFLRAETDYDVNADKGSVTGTQLTTLSPTILHDVKWMVLAGYENGGCKFDGWGAAVS